LVDRRRFLAGLELHTGETGIGATVAEADGSVTVKRDSGALKIDAVEGAELHGSYMTEAWVDRRAQVNPRTYIWRCGG
jgi:hypothetical protein